MIVAHITRCYYKLSSVRHHMTQNYVIRSNGLVMDFLEYAEIR